MPQAQSNFVAPSQHARTTRPILTRFITLGCFCLLYGLLILNANQLSFTNDEPSHLAAGYAFLARGKQGMWTMPLRGHPLLINAWEALPIFIGEPNLELESLQGWGISRPTFAQNFIVSVNALERTAMAARVPSALLTILLAAVVFRWAKALSGPIAGIIALGLLTFDPTLLAHGRLVTNDVGVTALGTLALYLTWRWTKEPSWQRAIVAGLVMGLTALAKASGVLWGAAGFLMMLWGVLWKIPTQRVRGSTRDTSMRSLPSSRSRIWISQAISTALVAFLVIWAMYGFEVGPLPNRLPFPVPAPLHWRGLFYHTDDAEVHLVFALGNLKQGHWWWYFPLAFLIKNPLPLILGTIVSPWVLLWRRKRNLGNLSLFFFPALYSTIALLQGPNMGYRHFLPIHPFLYLLIAVATTKLLKLTQKSHASHFAFYVLRIVLLACLVWLGISTLRTHPYELTFFNELIGGASQGWRYLASSNTDWCQGWKAIKTWQQTDAVSSFGFSGSTGYVQPKDYGITSYHLLPPTLGAEQKLLSPWLYPEPGHYVIGANTLSGLGLPFSENYAWFRYHTPDAGIANSHFYYHVQAPQDTTWLAQCTIPIAPLDKTAIQHGFGALDPRNLTYDCTQTWIYPQAGKTLGWYGCHDEILEPRSLAQKLYLRDARVTDPFAARHLTRVAQSFHQWDYRDTPAFALFEWDPATVAIPTTDIKTGYGATAETPPEALRTTQLINTPAMLQGPLAFIGARVYVQQDTRDVETWWRVTNAPITRPLSIMAHFLTPGGTVHHVADGLGISPLILRENDIIVQRHLWPETSNSDVIWLRTGVYWLDDGKRWYLQDNVSADALFIQLRSEE